MHLKDAVNADVAQLVERLFCKQRVGGSNPLVGLFKITRFIEL